MTWRTFVFGREVVIPRAIYATARCAARLCVNAAPSLPLIRRLCMVKLAYSAFGMMAAVEGCGGMSATSAYLFSIWQYRDRTCCSGRGDCLRENSPEWWLVKWRGGVFPVNAVSV